MRELAIINLSGAVFRVRSKFRQSLFVLIIVSEILVAACPPLEGSLSFPTLS